MKAPPRKAKDRKREQEATRLSRSDWLWILGVIGAIFFTLVGSFMVRIRYEIGVHADSLNRTLERWRPTYHLNDEQIRRIREIEIDFHGNGNRFTKPVRSAEDAYRHHREIAAVMKPEDGEHFLRDQEQRDQR